MAIPRELLESFGLTEEQVNQVIKEHSNTVSFLEGQRDEQKQELEGKISKLQKELDTLKAGDWQAKYHEEHKNFEQYKKDIANKAKLEKMKNAYISLLKETGIGEQFVDSIVGVTDFSGMTVGEDGELEGKEDLTKDAQEKWSGFIVKDQTKGANVQTPPESGIDMTREGFFKLPLNEQMNYANSHPAEAKEFLK